MLAIFALTLAAADPGPTPPKSVGVGSLAGLFSADDYPRDAADRNEQGRVQVTVHVDAAGAVSSCEIKQSSGFPSLDTRTCEIIAQRAKFLPARDSAGKPVPSETTQAVTWRLSNGPNFTPSEPYTASIILTYGLDKQPKGCRVESTGFLQGKTPATCPPPMMDAVATTVQSHVPDGTVAVINRTDFRLGPVPPLKLGPGEVLMERSVAQLSVDETGHRVSCEQTEADAPLVHADDLCAQGPDIPYQVRLGASGKPVPFTATVATTMIAQLNTSAPDPAPAVVPTH